MKKEKGNFEFVKDEGDDKGNYILQKDKTTKTTTIIVAVFLIIMVAAVVLSGVFGDFV